MGSSPVVVVMSRVTSRLTSYDVRIFRNFGLLPKCQQAKAKPMKIGEERTPKRGEEPGPGTLPGKAVLFWRQTECKSACSQ